MHVINSKDSTIFDKKPKFLGIFLIVCLIGVVLISLASFHAARELEVIHEVNNMNRIIHSLLGSKKIEQILRDGYHPEQDKTNVFVESTYRFYIFSNNHFKTLPNGSKDDIRVLNTINLESTRINEHGGFYETNGNIFTWVKFQKKNNNNDLIVIHKFTSVGTIKLMQVYKKRMIIPIFFYFLLMTWTSLIFNHLLQKLQLQKDQMKHMALHDSLTGLPNRNLMDDRLLKLIQINQRDKKQFACSLIDIDGFKGINDNYGHAFGDELLRQVAKRLKGILRESDTAARLGGDEFVVLLSDINEHNWPIAFDRVHAALVEPYTLFDTKITIKSSVGISIYSLHGDDAETLLRNADHAMYAIKAKGGGIRMYEIANSLSSPQDSKETKSFVPCTRDDLAIN